MSHAYFFFAAGGIVVERAVEDVLDPLDASARLLSRPASVDDAADPTDLLANIITRPRSLLEELTAPDDQAHYLRYRRDDSDVFYTLDNVLAGSAGVLLRTLSEGIDTSDLATRAAEFLRVVDDGALSTEDTLVRTGQLRDILDAIAFGDDLVRRVVMLRNLSDYSDYLDDIARIVELRRTLTDNETAVDYLGLIPRAHAVVLSVLVSMDEMDADVTLEPVGAGIGLEELNVDS